MAPQPAAAVAPPVESAQTLFTSGRGLFESRRYREAREHLRRGLELDPSDDTARALFGWTQYFLGDYREATISFKTALRRQPTWEGLYAGLGWSRLQLGRARLALVSFRDALDRNPRYSDALIGAGSALFGLAQYESALPLLEEALRNLNAAEGSDAAVADVVRSKTAWTLYHLGRYRDAESLFQRAIQTRPDRPQLLAGLGWCYLRLGRPTDARRAFEQALGLQPGYPDAVEGLWHVGRMSN
jgi:serine/threonine-protein kinase